VPHRRGIGPPVLPLIPIQEEITMATRSIRHAAKGTLALVALSGGLLAAAATPASATPAASPAELAAANASTSHRAWHGWIKICKETYDYHGRPVKFKFEIESDHYKKHVWVKGGDCSDEYKVKLGDYKITEYPKEHWTLDDITGDYEHKDVPNRWTDVHVQRGETDRLEFHNSYHGHH